MRRFLVAVAVTLVAACSGSDKSQPFSPAAPETLSAVHGNTIVGQHIPLTGGETYGVSPGVANYWDLDADFELDDGYDDQFDGALYLAIGSLTTSPPTFSSIDSEVWSLDYFPYDQNYDELTFYGPVAKAADGAVTAVVSADDADSYFSTISGTYSAVLNPTSDSRLSQAITLPAVSGGQTLTLSWTDSGYSYDGYLGATAPGVAYQSYFRVAVRDGAGALLAWALPATTYDNTSHTFDLTPYAGQAVTLAFEFRSNGGWYDYVKVDDVSVVRSDAPTTNLLVNGDFETGNLSGWTVNDTGEPTGIGSGVRTVDGLDVQRFFYTVPNKKWARWLDVLTNASGAPITADVVYYTNLGSDGAGFIYDTPGAGGKAISEWDTYSGDRDVGFAFGTSQAAYFPVQTFATWDGSDSVYFVRHVTVAAGQSIAFVNFIVMDGTDTGLTATDFTPKATGVDAALAAIVAGIRSDPQYLAGITPAQYAAIVNW